MRRAYVFTTVLTFTSAFSTTALHDSVIRPAHPDIEVPLELPLRNAAGWDPQLLWTAFEDSALSSAFNNVLAEAHAFTSPFVDFTALPSGSSLAPVLKDLHPVRDLGTEAFELQPFADAEAPNSPQPQIAYNVPYTSVLELNFDALASRTQSISSFNGINVPEPGTLALFTLGTALLLARSRHRRN